MGQALDPVDVGELGGADLVAIGVGAVCPALATSRTRPVCRLFSEANVPSGFSDRSASWLVTSNPAGVLVLVNGPIRRTIGVNVGANCMGGGARANVTIGRAMRLLLLNVGGAKHTEESMVTRITEAGLKIGEIRPVNAYLHAFECTVPT